MRLREWWKNAPIWLRFGLILTLVGVVYYTLFFIGYAFGVELPIPPFATQAEDALYGILCGYSPPLQLCSVEVLPWIVFFSIVLPLVSYFTIGALIGLIVGGIRNKKLTKNR